MEAEIKNAWKQALWDCPGPWIACGIRSSENGNAETVEGMAGLIDWYVHGQVSQLAISDSLPSGGFGLIPGDPSRARPSMLLYRYGNSADPKLFFQRVTDLRVRELHIAESTFPEDFLAKVKQTFKKEGIKIFKLEPDPR
jgi:hypothetical protein